MIIGRKLLLILMILCALDQPKHRSTAKVLTGLLSTLSGYVLLPKFVWYNEFAMVQYIVSRSPTAKIPCKYK